MEAGRSRQLTDCGRFSQASVKISNAIARNEVGITKKIMERNGGHGGQPDRIDKGHSLQQSGALAAEDHSDRSHDERRQHERNAEPAQEVVHAAHRPHDIELIVGHQAQQLPLGIIRRNRRLEQR